MKRFIIGAAGLLLGTSALAGVSAIKADGAKTMPTASPVAPKAAVGLDESMIRNAMLIDWPAKNAGVGLAGAGDKALTEPKAMQSEPVKPIENADTMASPADAAAKPAEPTTEDDAEMPSNVAKTPADPSASEPSYEGIGGPLEEPQPAAQNYPPCAPGPGDDRCIQLYEPGVRASLASWSGATGGLDNGQTGMGGPLEEIDQTSAVTSGDEEAAYEPLPEDAVMPASDTDDDLAATDSPTRSGESTMAI